MAHNSYARLTSNGAALTGDVSVTAIGGVDVGSDHIEVMRVSFGADTTRDVATGQARGRRQHQPLRLIKPIDRSTPLLYNALVRNEKISGEVLLFDTDPADGTIRQFFTITVADAALSGIASVSPDTRDAALAAWQAYEEVTLSYAQITLTHQPTGNEFVDQLGRNV